MRRRFTALVALVCAAAAPPPLRQPAKPWVLDYGETACTAVRDYGAGAAPLTLAFQPSPSGRVVRVSVVRSGRSGDAHHFPARLALGGAPLKTSGLRFTTRDRKKDVVWINVDRSALDGLVAAREIGIQGSLVIDERFALPQIAAVLKGLDTCTADLLKYWNIAEGSAVAHPPEPTRNPQEWVNSGDYPAQAFEEGASGAIRFILLVDETGKAKDCMVEESSGIATLDAQACIVLTERASFRPARDSAGKPVRSAWTSRLVFKL